jgi:hypothetical protein
MKKKILLFLFYVIVLILLGLYLIGLGIILTLLFNLIGLPQDEYNILKQLVLIILALLLAKFTLFPVIGFVASKIKKNF